MRVFRFSLGVMPLVTVAITIFAAGAARAQSVPNNDANAVVKITTETINYPATESAAVQSETLGSNATSVSFESKELCKTEHGRRLLLDAENEITIRDGRAQWEGLRANDPATEGTYEEYRLNRLAERCSNKPPEYLIHFGVPTPAGTCQDVRFLPPHYDIEDTIRRVRAATVYYRTSTERWAGANDEERKSNLHKTISNLLGGIEATLAMSYPFVRCKVGNTGRCAASTGQKRICERVYINAPPGQVLIADSLKGGPHVKEGPTLQSPTVAWFKVGKTGHGENWGTATAESTFDAAGAARKARAQVDVIRRELLKRDLSVDMQPPPERAPTPPKPPRESPVNKPAPAKLERTYDVRAGNGNFYDVRIVNLGGVPSTIGFRIEYEDRFFQGSASKWKLKAARSITILPGGIYEESFHDHHSPPWRIFWSP